jgi:hypothetical protein
MLSLSPETVFFAIVKAREFDVKDAVTEPDPGSNAADDKMLSVLEDHADDPVVEELKSMIDNLNRDQQIDLVALAWLGRGDYTADDWDTVRGEAAEAHTEHTSAYLLGIPLLGDYLEEGLSLLGYSSEEYQLKHL